MLSIFAGIAYLLGLFVMPTMILFAMIVGIFTVIQCIIDFYRHRSSAYILIINGTVFLVAITGLLLFGLNNPGIDLSTYSIGHVYAYLGLIFGTVVLYLLARALHGRQTWYYPAFLVGSAGIFAVILFVLAPQLYNLLIGSLFAFFGQQAITETVLEARGWSLDHAWFSFNYGLILFAGGALVMLYNNWRDEHPHQVFALVWSLVMFFSTWQHVRYEYYLAINIALLSAFCVGFVFERGWVQIRHRTAGISCLQGSPEHKNREDEHMPRKKLQKADRKKIARSPAQGYLFIVLFVLAALICALFALTSASYSYTNASDNAGQMNPDWRESLEWLGNNTPETGVNYLTIYDPVTFDYPPESYGIMSWWDYGHMITYISKRMPNANPFQQGVSGDSGAAAYFVSTSEDLTNTILDKLGTRYVITDIEMDTGKFPAMATWYNSSFAADPYMKTLLVPGAADPNRLEPRLLNTEQYYLTMVSRLHNFDGSMTPATTVYYVEYADPAVYGVSLPVVTNAETMNATDAMNRADQFNLNPSAGHHAMALSTSLVNPVGDIPALRHYRLIHESPSNVFDAATPDVKYVKVFEYVKGARIRGNGIIELPLVSNTGRIFTYRQESINGEFIVPFSTTGNPYDVHATGKYRISGTTLQFDVPEQAVMLGSYVN